MLFNSYEFILFFLPIALVGFALTYRRRFALGWLALCSLIFYAWWNPSYTFLLAGSVVGNFLAGRAVQRTHSKPLLTVAIALNLAVLAYYKYAAFFAEQVNGAFGTEHVVPHIVLPLAISFFTFQQITYLVECYRRTAVPHTWLDYALFVCFFPQLIAGPIVHESYIIPQISRGLRLSAVNLSRGIAYFFVGLFKKVVIADGAALYANIVFLTASNGQPLSFTDAWLGTMAYTVQLYFDFSGYSDMAIGLALLFGVRLPLNFNSPYKATSIIDFWRRWHMTLSAFLRDYLYIPLGGNRRGPARRYANLMIVMTLGGLWHGAGWTFVFWGFLHGLFLVVNLTWRSLFAEARFRQSQVWWLVSWILTLICVMFAWVFFRATDWGSALVVIKAMTWMGGDAAPQFGAKQWVLVCGALMIALLMPNTQEILSDRARGARGGGGWFPIGPHLARLLIWRPNAAWTAAVGGVALYCILKLGQNSEFLYFNF